MSYTAVTMKKYIRTYTLFILFIGLFSFGLIQTSSALVPDTPCIEQPSTCTPEQVQQEKNDFIKKINLLIALLQEKLLENKSGALATAEKITNNVGPKAITEEKTSSYTIDVEKWDIPSNRTNPEKTTANLQKAIDWASQENSFQRIILPKGHYLVGRYGNDIYQSGITIPSNIHLALDGGAVIEMVANDKWNYCVLKINSQNNVKISGGTLVGDRNNHIYTPRKKDGSKAHDEGHLICIKGEGENISIENMTLTQATGDGILVVGSPKNQEQKLRNIIIRNNNIHNNRRQGVSLVGSSNVTIENNEIHHIKGVSPQFGIDIEGAGRKNENITIRKNYFHHNTGGDIVNTDGKNVLVEENILEQGAGSRYIDGPLVYWKNADWVVKNNNITMTTPSVNNWNGIIMYSNDRPKTNPATSYIIGNTCNNCGFYAYKGADLVVKNNQLNKGHLAFREMKNLILENNKVQHPQKCWAYRFLKVSGQAKNNTYNGEPFPIPLSNTPWNGCWIK